MAKNMISPSYKLELFENSNSENFIDALSLYVDNIAPELRTSTNEITSWADKYNKKFDDELLLFGLFENNKLIGFSEQVYFKKEKFIHIDYFVIDKEYRGNHTFQIFFALFEKFYKNYKYEFNFIITEVEVRNEPLLQLLRLNSFGEIQSKYYQPQLGQNNHDSLIESKLLYFRADNDKMIKIETFHMIINTIYYNHYIRWYEEFFSEKELLEYKKNIEKLKEKIYDGLDKNVKILKGKKGFNEYTKFTVNEEIKNAATILGIVCLFSLFSLVLGRYFGLSTYKLLVLLMANLGMFFLMYSLVSKKGLIQLKLLFKLFDKIK